MCKCRGKTYFSFFSKLDLYLKISKAIRKYLLIQFSLIGSIYQKSVTHKRFVIFKEIQGPICCSDQLKNVEELCIRVCSVFFLLFPRKIRYQKNHWNG